MATLTWSVTTRTSKLRKPTLKWSKTGHLGHRWSTGKFCSRSEWSRTATPIINQLRGRRSTPTSRLSIRAGDCQKKSKRQSKKWLKRLWWHRWWVCHKSSRIQRLPLEKLKISTSTTSRWVSHKHLWTGCLLLISSNNSLCNTTISNSLVIGLISLVCLCKALDISSLIRWWWTTTTTSQTDSLEKQTVILWTWQVWTCQAYRSSQGSTNGTTRTIWHFWSNQLKAA